MNFTSYYRDIFDIEMKFLLTILNESVHLLLLKNVVRHCQKNLLISLHSMESFLVEGIYKASYRSTSLNKMIL